MNVPAVLITVILALMVGACDSRLPTTPTPTGAPSPAGTLTASLSGAVLDRISGRPIAATVSVYEHPSGAAIGLTATDVNGRYRVLGLRDNASVWVFARAGPQRQQCAASVTLVGDTNLDLQLADLADLATQAMPDLMMPPGTRTVSGVVFEITPTGRQPVARAWVGWLPAPAQTPRSSLEGVPPLVAETITDAGGRYLLCGLSGSTSVLFATAYGYDARSFSIAIGGDAVVDVEIERCTTVPTNDPDYAWGCAR